MELRTNDRRGLAEGRDTWCSGCARFGDALSLGLPVQLRTRGALGIAIVFALLRSTQRWCGSNITVGCITGVCRSVVRSRLPVAGSHLWLCVKCRQQGHDVCEFLERQHGKGG